MPLYCLALLRLHRTSQSTSCKFFPKLLSARLRYRLKDDARVLPPSNIVASGFARRRLYYVSPYVWPRRMLLAVGANPRQREALVTYERKRRDTRRKAQSPATFMELDWPGWLLTSAAAGRKVKASKGCVSIATAGSCKECDAGM